jgi:hypothetical protein
MNRPDPVKYAAALRALIGMEGDSPPAALADRLVSYMQDQGERVHVETVAKAGGAMAFPDGDGGYEVRVPGGWSAGKRAEAVVVLITQQFFTPAGCRGTDPLFPGDWAVAFTAAFLNEKGAAP